MDLAASDQSRKGKMKDKALVRKEKSTESVKKLDSRSRLRVYSA